MLSHLNTLASVIAVSLVLSACGKPASDRQRESSEKAEGAENLTITGQLVLSTATDVPDTAIAFPVSGGVFERSSLTGIEPSPLISGQLALELESETSLGFQSSDGELGASHVIAVYSENADRFAAGESMRFVTLDTGAGTSAVNILTSDLKEPSLDFGSISSDSEELLGSKPANAETFERPEDVIQELAATDDSLRKIKNDFMNTVVDQDSKAVTQYIETTPSFTFSAPASRLLTASLDSPPALKYAGFLMHFGAQHPDLSLSTLCGTTTGKLRLKTPTGTTIRSGSFTFSELNNDNMDPSQTMNSNDPTRQACYKNSSAASNNGFGMFIASAPGEITGLEALSWNWSGTGSDGFDGPIPAGIWTMTFGTGTNGPVIAKFDLAAAYPLDGDGRPLVYIPSVKVTSNPISKVIEKMEIVWFLWDKESQAFRRVEDLTAFRSVVSQLSAGFFDFSRSGARAEQGSGVPFPDQGSTFVVSKSSAVSNNGWTFDWRLDTRFYGGQDDADGGSGAQPTAEVVSVGYKMYGTSYNFSYSLSRCYCAQSGQNFKVFASNTQLDLSGDFPSNSFTSLDACYAALDAKLGMEGAVCR